MDEFNVEVHSLAEVWQLWARLAVLSAKAGIEPFIGYMFQTFQQVMDAAIEDGFIRESDLIEVHARSAAAEAAKLREAGR